MKGVVHPFSRRSRVLNDHAFQRFLFSVENAGSEIVNFRRLQSILLDAEQESLYITMKGAISMIIATIAVSSVYANVEDHISVPSGIVGASVTFRFTTAGGMVCKERRYLKER